MSHDPKEPWTPEMKADEAVDRESCIAAVDHALAAGWRPKDIVGLLRGTQRYANGFIVAVCERCRRPEYEDGLILTEVTEIAIRCLTEHSDR